MELEEQISPRQLRRMIILETGSMGCLFVAMWAGRENGILAVLLSIIGSLVYGGLLLAIGQQEDGYCAAAENSLPGMIWHLLWIIYLIRFAIRAAWILSYLEYIIETTLLAANRLMILIPLLIVCGYAGIRNLVGRARFVELLFWWVIIPLIGLFLVGLWKADMSLLTPQTTVSVKELLAGDYRLMVLFLPLELVLFRVAAVRGNRHKIRNVCMRGILISGLWMLLVYSVTVGILGVDWSSQRLSGVTDAMELISVRGGGLERIDIILILVWLIGGIITLSAYCFQGQQLLTRILPAKAPVWVLSLGMTGLVLIIYFCLPDAGSWSQWYLKYACWIDLPLSIILPLCVTGIAGLRKRKRGVMDGKLFNKNSHSGVKQFGIVLLALMLAGVCSGCGQQFSIEDRTYVGTLHIRQVSEGYEYRCTISYMDAQSKDYWKLDAEEDMTGREYMGVAESIEAFDEEYETTTGSRLDYSHLEGIYLDKALYPIEASGNVLMPLWEETQVVLSTPIYQEELLPGEQTSETLGYRLKQIGQVPTV